jgi:hypothetical protein
MTSRDAIRTALTQSEKFLADLLGDFTDAEMFVRPVPGANHAAWQVGNVIAGDLYLLQEELPEAKFPQLPDGFMEQHGSKGTKLDGPDGFHTRDEYLTLLHAVRAATIAAADKLTDADLDRPTREAMRGWVPTLGEMLVMAATHTMMHAGQFSVIRRKLGKPVLL